MCSYRSEAMGFALKHLRQRDFSEKSHITDLDRLHRVVARRWRCGRGEGRTFASCHHLAGLLMTVPPGSLIVWPLPEMGWLYHIMPMLQDVLSEHGISWEDCRYGKIKALDKTVLFLPVNYGRGWLGVGEFYEVDTYGETEEYRNRTSH